MKPQAPALAELYAKRPTVIKPGLARIERALEALGRDALFAAPQVLVGGTNGKGSTIGLLWQLLGAARKNPGLFTSPHLARFEERIQVYETEVTEELLLQELGRLKSQLARAVYDDLSFFEVNTLLALATFRRLGSRMDLLEVGLGGRWDSTNVADPVLSVITSIGLDHQQYLGETTSEIAFEKAGIMRPGRPVLWGGDEAGDARAVATIRERATAVGAILYEMGRDFGQAEGAIAAFGKTVPWPRKAEAWPSYLRRNFVMAVAAAAYLVHDEADLRGAAQAIDDPSAPMAPSLRGRFEMATVDGRRLLLDVCHNVDGAKTFRSALEEKGWGTPAKPLPGVVSILADKDTGGILDVLRPVLSPLRLFASSSERAWSPADLAARHADLEFYPSFVDAWRATSETAGTPVVVCGSVHAVGDVMTRLGLLR